MQVVKHQYNNGIVIVKTTAKYNKVGVREYNEGVPTVEGTRRGLTSDPSTINRQRQHPSHWRQTRCWGDEQVVVVSFSWDLSLLS